jgi:hypothetical protein
MQALASAVRSDRESQRGDMRIGALSLDHAQVQIGAPSLHHAQVQIGAPVGSCRSPSSRSMAAETEALHRSPCSRGLVLVTHDRSHIERIRGLRIDDWL